jgi:hypothetical protein
MAVIVLVPEADCDGCDWKTIPVGQLDLSPQAVDGLFDGRYVHENFMVKVLHIRASRCPIHGPRGYR